MVRIQTLLCLIKRVRGTASPGHLLSQMLPTGQGWSSLGIRRLLIDRCVQHSLGLLTLFSIHFKLQLPETVHQPHRGAGFGFMWRTKARLTGFGQLHRKIPSTGMTSVLFTRLRLVPAALLIQGNATLLLGFS